MTKIIDEHLSGEGTQANPYVIHDSTGLGYLSGANLGDYGVDKYYELGADIDMSSVASFTPIGSLSNLFSGHFDGKNHTISGLNLHTVSNGYGLFSWTRGGEIKNIIINNSYLVNDESSTHYYCGLLVGYATAHTTIQNIIISNSCIESDNTITNVGVIVGEGDPYIYDCIVKNCVIDISISSRIGGVIGNTATNGSISNCSVRNCYLGDGGSGGYTGGICGSLASGFTITNCDVLYCTIVGGSYTGGIYGMNSLGTSTITGCTVSDCSIIGTSNVAGVGN